MKYLSSPIKSNTNIPIFSPPISKTNDINISNNNMIEKINDINEKIQELGKEGEIYTLRVFDLDAFVDSNPNLTVDDLYMLTFMDENSEKIVEE